MTDTESRQVSAEPPYVPSHLPRPTAWVGMVLFAGVMLFLLGGFEAMQGFVALLRDDYYFVTSDGLMVSMDFVAWGWTHLILGVLALGAGVGVLLGQMWARVIGIAVAGLSALTNIAFLPAYPVWCTIVIALDVLSIYALAMHGREVRY